MKTTFKKVLCTVTAVACIAGGGSVLSAQQLEIVPINAVINAPISAPVYEIAQQNLLNSIRVYGTASTIGDHRITLENSNENDPYQNIVVNVSEDTLILDAVSGLPLSFDDIRENEILYAYVGPVMTMSLPPIANAELILASIPADFGVPDYVEVDKVVKNEDGSVVLNTNRDISYTVTEDTELFPYLTKNIVFVDNIRPGSKLLVWNQAAVAEQNQPATDAESGEPADEAADNQPADEAKENKPAEPAKIMLMPYTYSGYVDASLGGLAVNGEALELSDNEKPHVQNGRLMLPLRQFAEALGYTIEWDAEKSQITVLSGERTLYSLIARGSEASRGDETYTLREEAKVQNGVTFMAADDLIELNGVKIVK